MEKRNFMLHISALECRLELSSRPLTRVSCVLLVQVWSCGGSMEVVPCSRVAHLSRHHLPYQFPDQELLQRNKIRVADTWMEAYKKIFYRRDTLAHFIRQVCVNLHGPSRNKLMHFVMN